MSFRSNELYANDANEWDCYDMTFFLFFWIDVCVVISRCNQCSCHFEHDFEHVSWKSLEFIFRHQISIRSALNAPYQIASQIALSDFMLFFTHKSKDEKNERWKKCAPHHEWHAGRCALEVCSKIVSSHR